MLPLYCILFDMFVNIFFILKAREEEMTAKVIDLQTQLEELQKKYQQRLEQEENPGNDKVRGTGLGSIRSLKTLSFSLARLLTYLPTSSNPNKRLSRGRCLPLFYRQ